MSLANKENEVPAAASRVPAAPKKRAPDVESRQTKRRKTETEIRHSLGDERSFHLDEVAYYLQWASECAEKGNRDMMEHYLKEAREHAEKAGSLNEDFHSRAATIRDLLGDERTFHLDEVAYYLQQASECAEKGNRDAMEYYLKKAREHKSQVPPSYDEIPLGTRISLKGLVTHPDCNGVIATVSQYDPKNRRYLVVLEGTNKQLSVKASNIFQRVRVNIHGVEKEPTLNGMVGTTIAWNARTERYHIDIMARGQVSLKPGNVIFGDGTVGSITGITSKPELNGKWGTINAWIPGTNKYDVQLSADKIIRIKTENFRV